MSLLDTASLIITPNGTKAGKLYSVVPSSGAGDLNVTRATTATRVNSAGLIESVASNVPRLDYSNGTCPSILVEPQRTNLLTYSEQFDNAAWTKTNVTITANSTDSPDGTTNADTLTKSGTGVDGTIVRVVSATATGYVGSIFVKKDTNTSRFPEFFLRSSDAAGENEIYVQLNTSTGATSIRLQFGTVSVSTPVLINGYWRLSFYALANSNTCRFGIRPAAGTTLGVFNANATGSIIAWGAQLEAGSYATSYIPTTSASVTRNADVISKTSISSLIGQAEGTIYMDGDVSNLDTFISLKDLGGKLLDFLKRKNDIVVYASNGVTDQWFNIYAQTELIHKSALVYKNNDWAIYVNGVLIASNNTAQVFTLSELVLNLGEFKTFALWKTRLTNTQLAQLTTI